MSLEQTVLSQNSQLETHHSSASGIALIIVLLAILLMSALALGLATASSVELTVATAYRDGQATLYAADAGLEYILGNLAREDDWNAVLAGSARAALVDGPPSGTRNAHGRTIDLSRLLDAARGERRPWGLNNPVWQLYAYAPAAAIVTANGSSWHAYVVVLVADDPSESDQNPLVDGGGGRINGDQNPGAGKLVVRAIAFGQSGATRTIQATIERVGPDAIRLVTWRELAWGGQT